MNDFDELKPTSEKESSQIEAERAALETTVWRKLDRWALPLCTCTFLLAYMDRANIGNARVAGMQRSLAMSNYQYTIVLTVTYIPHALSNLPPALLFKHVGPNLMVPAMVVLWGVVSAAQGFANSFSTLLACRFLLGVTEGGLFPCIVLFLSSFYPRQRLQIRIATFFVSSSLAGAFSGLLAAAINQLDKKAGRPGWAWIFILEGAFTIVFGIISFFLLPRSPEKAWFLTEKERAYVTYALKHAGSISEDNDEDKFSWTEVARTAKSVHVWLLGIVIFFSGTILTGLAIFEPTIVAGLGYSGNHAQLMSVPPFALTFVLSVISAIISDLYQCRGCIVIFFSILQLSGFSMFYASTSNHVRYVSLFFSVPGTYGAPPALVTWLANNSAPHVRRATAVAVCSSLTQVGGILSTWLLGWLSPAPDYTVATITFIVMSICIGVFSTANIVYLWRENRLKAEKRQRMRKEEEPEGLGDRSAWFIYSL